MRGAAAVLCLAAIVLAACNPPTPYRQAGPPSPYRPSNGFSDVALVPGRYQVSFKGNWVTPQAVVEDYMLLRAAEITLDSGNDWFLVLDRHTHEQRIRGALFDFVPVHGHYYYGIAHPGFVYTAVAEILVATGAAPVAEPDAYDARDVLRRLRPVAMR